jgi:hypothetical protein
MFGTGDNITFSYIKLTRHKIIMRGNKKYMKMLITKPEIDGRQLFQK